MSMPRIAIVVLAILLNLLAVWIVVGPWFPKSSIEAFSVVAFFGLSALGGFWMLYTAVRYERRPLLFLFLALIPYAFI